MSAIERIGVEFVELMPKPLTDGVVYVSTKYATASHNCCCGCGMRIVTPLKAGGWRYELDKKGRISLYPSIGNWSTACQSHYWIRRGRVIWAAKFSSRQIQANRARDQRALERRYPAASRSGKEFFLPLWKRVMRIFGRG